jgi:hypothetical protein
VSQKDRRLQKAKFAEEINHASGCSVFKNWELVLSELRRELDALIKKFNDTKLEEKPTPRKPVRFSLSNIGLLGLSILFFVSLVVFGAMYYKYSVKQRRLVVTLCTVTSFISLTLIIFFLFCRKKIEKIEIPLIESAPKGLLSDLDNFAKRYKACIQQFVQSFRCLHSKGEVQSQFIRIYILIETL